MTTAPRCTYTNQGIPSINHPERPIYPPWSCARDAGHDGGHAPVKACPQVAQRDGDVDWPCVYAEGHIGDCKPPTEARYVRRPLREMDHEELAQAAALAFHTAEAAELAAAALNGRLLRSAGQVASLAAHVLDNVTSPHGSSHVRGCWTKHPHCLAFAIIGSGGLDRAVAELRTTRPESKD